MNCTTIDWFLPWPEEALISTAQYKIMNVQFQGSPDEVNALRSQIVNSCYLIQAQVKIATQNFYNEYRRYNYVTPIGYLDFLQTFKILYDMLNTKM